MKLPDNFAKILNGLTELKGWTANQEPQFEKGENLFLLINGGAEIYFEYGFKQALITGYKNNKQKSFNLEIYEMHNSAAAYGVYSYKTQKEGETLNIGHESKFEDYYLNLWKGNYVITITGFDAGNETKSGIIEAARILAGKIKQKADKPELVKTLCKAAKRYKKPEEVKFLKGNLALFNYYNFDNRNIFGLGEGVIGDFGDFTMFVFKYPNKTEGTKWFKKSVSHLKISVKFTAFKSWQNRITFQDKKGHYLILLRQDSCILIYKSKFKDKYFKVFKKICQNLY